MARPYALLRAGFPYLMSLGMRRVTSNPVDLAWGGDGRIYVLCRGGLNKGIRVIDWDDGNHGTFGAEDFQWPAAVIIDREENSTSRTRPVTRSPPLARGETIRVLGRARRRRRPAQPPSGMAFDADENIYVSDTLNHRVQKLTKDGAFLMKWGEFGQGDGQFNMPWGIAIDELGDVYVADWRNDRVQKFTAEGGSSSNSAPQGAAMASSTGPRA